MSNLKQYEKDETLNLLKIADDMNRLHSSMGGRDSRPERKALLKCMVILHKEIERARKECAG